MSPAAPFDLLGALPAGRLAIEASAGTGKTYTLAALATRLVAEGRVTVDRLLVVTFTRAATAELRSRVRDRLVEAATHLESHLADPGTAAEADELLRHLATHEPDRRLARLRDAIGAFDTSTITTIHGFATQVLGTVGAAAGTDRDAVLVDDARELVSEVCADLLAAASARHPGEHLPTHRTLVLRTRVALSTPDLAVQPEAHHDASPAALLLASLVRDGLAEIRARRHRSAAMSFDDLLVELRAGLRRDGGAVARAIRERYGVALIDEFQDTDPVQWEIFRTLFGAAPLVLVGDPKQAIYAFRGANVHTYLAAIREAGTERGELARNWRSDGRVLRATEALLGGCTFGSADIPFTSVEAAPLHAERALTDAAGAPLPALDLRLAVGADIERQSSNPDLVANDAAERAIVADLAARVLALLEDARIPERDGPRRVRPNDVAVLVRTAEEAANVQARLIASGIPAVLARGASVLESPAAAQWGLLLDAMSRPTDPRRARTFALSWFGGWSAEQVHAAADDDLIELQERLHGWAAALARHGVADLVQRVVTESHVAERVLVRPDGDRAITDLQHVAELLQAGGSAARPSIAGLQALLQLDPVPEADAEMDTNIAARRVETDAEAVQIMTVWVSKGLEFPIVCVPTMWRSRTNDVVFVDDDGLRTFDVANTLKWPDAKAAKSRKERAEAEADGEALRLLYVALTRARHQTLLWWTPGWGSARSPLARVLFARDELGGIDPEALAAKPDLPPPAATAARLAPLAERSGGTIRITTHGAPAAPGRPWAGAAGAGAGAPLGVASVRRPLDRTTERWSFTSLAARAEHSLHARFVDPFDPSGGDAGAADEAVEGSVDGAAGPRSEVRPEPAEPVPELPAGAQFGSLVHEVLEAVDFAAPDARGELVAAIARLRRRHPAALDLVHDAALVEALDAALATPLGPLFAGAALRDLARTDRLDEVGFELVLATSGPPVTDRAIGALVADHLQGDDLLRPWATSLAGAPERSVLAGHLTGSIDLVARVRGAGVEPDRFVVADYKTNRLHPPHAASPPGAYGRTALAHAMAAHHYPLQSLLYGVVLHRYLRGRLPGYEPATHLGGIAYLFLRGMTGPATPAVDGHIDGVFDWAVPPALVVDLSDLLDGHLARDVVVEVPHDVTGGGVAASGPAGGPPQQLSLGLGR